MPIYEYACKGCGLEFEELIRGEERPACPSCGAADVERQLSVTAAHVSGAARDSCPAKHVCAGSSCCGKTCDMAKWG